MLNARIHGSEDLEWSPRKKQHVIVEADMICFYSKSADSPATKGAREVNHSGKNYTDLDCHKDWRKVLSNFDVGEFTYKGYTYKTIEHAFQAAKIALADPEKAHWFTVESGHEIGQGDGAMAQSKRKLVTLDKARIQQWNRDSMMVMEEIAIAKYEQCPHAREILMLTHPAQLWHIQLRKTDMIHFTHLERIREKYVHATQARVD